MGARHLSQAICDRAKLLDSMYGYTATCGMLGISQNTLTLLKRRGFKAAVRKGRPMPSDFKLVAHGQTIHWLAQNYHVSLKTVRRWLAEAPDVERPYGGNKKDAPADLVEVLSRMTVAEAEHHFKVCNDTLTRWRREAGIRTRYDPPDRAMGWAERHYRELAKAA